MSRIFQIDLICAILAELDRQQPGVCVDQRIMNAIIGAADSVVTAFRLAREKEMEKRQEGR